MNPRVVQCLGGVVLAAIAVTFCPQTTCAGTPGSASRTVSLETLGPPARNQTRDAFLSPLSLSSMEGAIPRLEGAASGHRASSLEAFAYKISFVSGLLLTADQVVRSVDSVMDAATYRRDDGSYLRLNAEPMSRGFLVGLVMSRPLDF
jgi:hypothetical protein